MSFLNSWNRFRCTRLSFLNVIQGIEHVNIIYTSSLEYRNDVNSDSALCYRMNVDKLNTIKSNVLDIYISVMLVTAHTRLLLDTFVDTEASAT